MTDLLVVGGGKMGEALIGGLLASGWADDALAVVEPAESRRGALSEVFPGVRVVASLADAPAAPAALVAVKPDHVASVCRALGDAGVKRILSIAAGVRLDSIEAEVPEGTAVVRAMPNTPAMVGAGAAAIAAGMAATDEDLAWAEAVLGAVGTVTRVSESQLDAVTGLSGSGPAYVFLVAEALIDAGVLVGLARPVATELAIQTLLGASELLASGSSPAELRAAVTSPGGTTAAGLRALEAAGVRAAFSDAVVAATARSRELG
ncbi:MAG: pyrroline-5-carboxylate reductase [Acidimicrobiales bacterium]|nr:pyrroline-5-carboxylate reductase [Acidimicrobiales bacterium]